jgi:N-methylhydantoinase B
MPLSVQAAIQAFPHLLPGDIIMLNDPYLGGTHLPDITLVSPVYMPGHENEPAAYVASRAHHADVGGYFPGSMGVATELFQEGIIIPPVRLVRQGQVEEDLFKLLLANVRTPQERAGDIWAQIAANRIGDQRMQGLVQRYGLADVHGYMQALMEYTERMTRRLLQELPDGSYAFCDQLDDDGVGEQPVKICAQVTIDGDEAIVDFSGSDSQVAGSLNAVYAITVSAVYYVFRCLIGLDAPNNAGCLAPIRVIAPEGTVVNARKPSPVSGGNVETSQRIVDALLGALAQAAPGRVPAASQGTMNNVTIGGWDEREAAPFTYYETIAGGMGASPEADGASGLHSHMTNTLNTPAEALEYAYPLRVLRLALREGSGGKGRHRGGDGIRRDIQVLVPARANLISERRKRKPYGLSGGGAGASGENYLIRGEQFIRLPGKGEVHLQAGDILSIRTPGGGGFGQPSDDSIHEDISVAAALYRS